VASKIEHDLFGRAGMRLDKQIDQQRLDRRHHA
jgi:hypothetical protein